MAHYSYLVNGFGIGKDFFWIYMFGRVSRMYIQNRARWKYHYTIADHLGNARVEFVPHNGGQPEVVQSVSYYPFGYTLHCNDYGSRQPNRHLFGGKELQDQTLAGITFGWYDFEARMYDPAIGRFMQTDPMAEKYYWISPYAYCANNPIKFVDPTGEDIWEINNEGRIINRIKDKSQDAFYMVEQDADGNYQRTFTTDAEGNKIYNSISFEYGTIESQRSISFSPDGQTTDTYDVYRIRGDNNGTALFEFMSNNISGSRTGVEISQAMTGIKGDKGLNFITTGHTKAKEPGMTHLLMGQLLNGYTIRELNHSHPYTPNPSSSDKRFASQIKDIMKQRNISVPEFNLYYVPDKQKIPFGR